MVETVDRNVMVETRHHVSTPQPPWTTSLLLSPSQWKKSFLMFRWNLQCFSLCPSPLVLSQGTAEGSLTLYFNMCFSGIWAHWWDSPWIFSSVGWMLPVLSAFPPVICAADPWLLSPVCLCRGGPELDAAFQVCCCQCWAEGKDFPPPPPGTTLQMQPRTSLSNLGVHCWPLFVWVSSGTPGLACGAAFQQVSAQCSCCILGLSQPMCGASHFCVVNCVRLLAAHLCSLPGSPGMTSQPSGTSSPPSLCHQQTFWDHTWPCYPDH